MTTDHESRLRQMAEGDFIIPDDLAAESIRWAIAELTKLRERLQETEAIWVRDLKTSSDRVGALTREIEVYKHTSAATATELEHCRLRNAQLQRDYANSQEFSGQLEQRLVDLGAARDAAYEYGVRALAERDKLQKECGQLRADLATAAERVGKMSHHLGLLAGRQPERFWRRFRPDENGWYWIKPDGCEPSLVWVDMGTGWPIAAFFGPLQPPPGDAVEPAEVETTKVMCANGEVVTVGIGATEVVP